MSKSEFSRTEEEVYNLLLHHFQAPLKMNLILGVSGGPDSVALLRILHNLGISIHVVHINYGLRNEESDADQQLVESICANFLIPYNIYKLDPSDITGNFQDWARNERFSILEKEMKNRKADGIALGHHLDDQLETILLKILRGAGPDRWGGMSEWDGIYLRPLLWLSKNEIINYLSLINQSYRTDRSNLGSSYARNLLRHELLGQLDAMIPGWKENLLRIQQYSQSESELLEEVVDRMGDPNNRVIDRKYLLKFSRTTQISLLLKFIDICFGISYRQHLSRDQLIDISDHLEHLTTGKVLNIGEYLSLIRDRDNFILETQNSDSSYGFSEKITEQYLQEQDYSLKKHLRISLQKNFPDPPKNFQGLVMDADKLQWPLILRNWQSGDRIRPLGMNGSQTIADHLINNKIASHKKKDTIVLKGFDQTIYAVIFPVNKKKLGTVSHFSKCDKSTSRYLIFKPIYK